VRIALIGRGRTGRAVWNLLAPHEQLAAFDRSNPPSLVALRGADAVIVFTPGEAVPELSRLLEELPATVYWGSTGHVWPESTSERLARADRCWITAANFSPGMVCVRALLEHMTGLEHLLGEHALVIEETHHAGKRDAPSGTALAWRDWLGCEVTIESNREGDVVGRHRMTVQTPLETMHISHEARDRDLFAHGAIWAARTFTINHNPGPGLHRFEDLARDYWEASR